MTPVEVLDDLFFFERGYLNANHLAFRGPQPVLIDTGYIRDQEKTLRSLAAVGIDPSDVHCIVSTHCHCDHIGANHLIQDMSGCGIVMHRVGRFFINRRNDWATWWRYFEQEAAFFDVTHAVVDGDRIQVGSHVFEVIHTPGHAADLVALYHRPTRLLISSDALWSRDMAVINTRVEGSAALIHHRMSLERLSTLDIECVCPGHGPVFHNVSDALQSALARVDRFMAEPRKMGMDLLKKIMVYTLMMKDGAAADRFYADLMATSWFPETVTAYLDGDTQGVYHEITADFLRRGIIRLEKGRLQTTVER